MTPKNMIATSSPRTRLGIFSLTCAAVMLCVTCWSVAGASLQTNQEESGENLRQLPIRPPPLSERLRLAKSSLQPEVGYTSPLSEKYREILPILDPESRTRLLSQGKVSNNPPGPDKGKYHVTISQLQRGPDEAEPESDVFASDSLRDRQSYESWQPQERDRPLMWKVPQSGNPHNPHPLVVRKALKKVIDSFRRPRIPELWDEECAKESDDEGAFPEGESAKVGDALPSRKSSLFPSQPGEYWSYPPPRDRKSGLKEINELPAVASRSKSSSVQSSNPLSRAAPRASSITNSLVALVIKRNPRTEKLTPSIKDFPEETESSSSSSSQSVVRKKLRSHLFKDAETSQGKLAADVQQGLKGPSQEETTRMEQRPFRDPLPSRFSPTFNLFDRKVPTRKDDPNLKRHDTPRRHYGAYWTFTTTSPPVYVNHQVPPYPSFGKGKEKSFPLPRVRFTPSSGKHVGNAAKRGSTSNNTPGRSEQSGIGFRGLKNHQSQAVNETSSALPKPRTNSPPHKGTHGRFKIANAYPPLTQRYSFSQRRGLAPNPQSEKTHTEFTSRPPVTQTTTVPTPRASLLSFKDTQLPEIDVNPTTRRVKIHNSVKSLKGFGSRALEGAKTSPREPDEPSTLQRGLEPFKLGTSRIWQPGRILIQRLYNESSEKKLGGGNTTGRSEPGNDRTPLETERSANRSTKNLKFGKLERFWFIKNKTVQDPDKSDQKFAKQNPIAAAESLTSRPIEEIQPRSRTPNRSRPPVGTAKLLKKTFASSVTRGRRVNAKQSDYERLNGSTLANASGYLGIVRPPKWLKLVEYADVLASTSFGRVKATNQTLNTSSGEDNLPNITKIEEKMGSHGLENASDTSPKPIASGPDEENKFVKGKEDEKRTSGVSLDEEGSGSGAFDLPDIETLGTNMAELNYLQTSTWNMSFKSVKPS